MEIAIICIFFDDMAIAKCFFLMFIIITPLTCLANEDALSQDKPKAHASLEIGADSNERRFYRPHLRFEFPIQRNTLFSEVNYYQRINSQLKGEVDFWIKAGWIYGLTNFIDLEASLNHFCRHITSRSYRSIFDANEVLARLWYRAKDMRLGLGGGFYIGGYEWYDNLFVFNFKYPNIFHSEFGVEAEIKLINFTEVLYDLEFFISLNENMDLFARNTRHYEYNNTTYLGIRFKSGGEAASAIRKLELDTGFYPSFERHKMESRLAVDLEFFKGQNRRLQLSMLSRIPILRDDTFFHVFRPETIEYPLFLQYERKISRHLSALTYCLYDVTMPIDVDQPFTSNLGVGVGLKSQPFFDKLDKTIRFALFGGPNFSRSYDLSANVGVNTVGRSLNFGVNAKTRVNADTFDGSITLFGEFGSELKVRIFVAGETTEYVAEESPSENRWLFGISLFAWFDQT